ncbi:hypothetical protein AB0I53_08625 [Saccharopolyspora sp. NPDC050389]|uniref:hypothetical protein n=1 Tax=Saccharopolyspora sp. NPDC050389 TaxID=3155516 RepID=UPI0033C04FB1
MPRDHGHLAALDGSYGYLRQFTPQDAVGFAGATELLEAVEILRDLNATVTAYRHYWELCTLLALRDGLRPGDVFVPGSRRYSDPAASLLTLAKWADQRVDLCRGRVR